jgi:hypothetical protein
MRRRVLAVLVVASFALAVPADAHRAVFASRIKRTSIAKSGSHTVTAFGGFVASRRPSCEAGRRVVVAYGDTRFGTGTTTSGGSWKVTGDGPTGRTYRFVVTKRVLVAEGHRHVCAAASYDERIT